MTYVVYYADRPGPSTSEIADLLSRSGLAELEEQIRLYKPVPLKLEPGTVMHSMGIKLQELQAERDEARDAYDTLSGLLRKRFPVREDGTLPDFKIEDVLRENDELRRQLNITRGEGK